jgi:hypothetical protein
MVDSQQRLCLAEIVFYVVAVPTCIWILFCHGFSWMKSKWIYYISILSILRIGRCAISFRDNGQGESSAAAVLGSSVRNGWIANGYPLHLIQSSPLQEGFF